MADGLVQILLVSAAVTCAACYPVLHLLQRAGRLDLPNTRSSHAVPTPRGGGLALLVGVAAAGLVALVLGPPWSETTWAAVAGCVALALVGLADDLAGLTPQRRLVAQAVIGAATGAALGGPVAALLGALVIPAAVNMVNFMDGINGICAGHAVVWGAGAIAAATYAGGDVLTVLGALSLGCGLGFLPWNVPRARLFLGDVGSYLVGGLAGVGVLSALTALLPDGRADGAWPLLGLVCAPYLLFAVDTATALVRRARRGQPVFQAHRSHVYQQLTNDRGLPHWVVSLAMVVLSSFVTTAVTVSSVTGLVTAVLVSTLYLVSPRLARRQVAL